LAEKWVPANKHRYFRYMKKNNFYIIIVLLYCLQFVGCKTNNETKNGMINNHSYSNYLQVKTTHLDWKANINFDKKIIEGEATWHFTNKNNDSKIIFDTKKLSITKVLISGKEIAFSLDTIDHEYLGSALQIPIQKNDSVVTIIYTTASNAKALQWLTPQQTTDKKMPYLFTQCEAIACRSIIPCQDAPAVRVTYNADVTVPKGMMAVMSADNPQVRNANGNYKFVMDIPVPSYLIALCAGDLDFKAIDARSGVYAEPSILAKAQQELTDIPNMIASAEKLAGPYGWKRYDVLIQPPSFPIGGMENPKLTFATPTILAGDKSLVSLIAHELAHSWSGNTVTNASWDDVWLNEGFTTYFERRIMENITDTSYSDMLWELSYQDMMADIKDLGDTNKDTRLKLDMTGRDPEEAFTNIPYEKGAHFLWLIEKTVGRKTFDAFMIKYFADNKFKPMTTDMALTYMDENLWKNNEGAKKIVDVEQWIFHSGVPTNCPRPGHTRFDAVDNCRNEMIVKEETKADYYKWSTHEWLQFLRKLPRDLSLQKMKKLDERFRFTQTKNSEIAFEWYMLSLQTNYTVPFYAIENFLKHVGRKKFVVPLYKQMMKDPKNANMAKSIFALAKETYHPATTKAVGEVVK
jgi:leukotriene-A4 hydrolase